MLGGIENNERHIAYSIKEAVELGTTMRRRLLFKRVSSQEVAQPFMNVGWVGLGEKHVLRALKTSETPPPTSSHISSPHSIPSSHMDGWMEKRVSLARRDTQSTNKSPRGGAGGPRKEKQVLQTHFLHQTRQQRAFFLLPLFLTAM